MAVTQEWAWQLSSDTLERGLSYDGAPIPRGAVQLAHGVRQHSSSAMVHALVVGASSAQQVRSKAVPGARVPLRRRSMSPHESRLRHVHIARMQWSSPVKATSGGGERLRIVLVMGWLDAQLRNRGLR